MAFQLSSSRLTATVDPLGAQLTSLKLDGTERLWQGDPSVWNEHAPVLFPIVGRVRDGVYRYQGKEYSIACPHGFARTSLFSVTEQTASKVTLRLLPDDQTEKQYPFFFVFDVTYELEENVLRMTFRVQNDGANEMYYSFGAHPGFRIPPDDGTCFEDWYLRFAEGETLTEATLDGIFMSGKTRPLPYAKGRDVPLDHEMFANDAFILTGLKNKTVQLRSDKSPHRVTVDCSGFDYLAFWQAYSKAEYLCVEPWNGLPSLTGSDEDLTKKLAIRRLAPDGVETCGLTFVLE